MMTEDFDIFLNADEFATTGTVGTTSIVGILDRDFAEVNGVEGYAPTLLCKESDTSSIYIGSQLEVAGQSYKVMAKRPDGTGMTTLILEVIK